MIVGFFGPLPPARTGVADYAASLLTALRKRGSVEAAAKRADIDLYHLGNNQLHADTYRRALSVPGVIVLHDAVLNHFLLGLLSREDYIAEFVYNYGDWTRDLAVDLWKSRARSAADRRYFDYPMLRRIVEVSRAVIVHNTAAARIVRDHVRDAAVTIIPHLAFSSAPPAAWEIAQFRQTLGASLLEPVCGVFGYLRESKRIPSVIAACERTNTALVIAGECPSDLCRRLAPLLQKPFVRSLPFAGPDGFELLMHSVDICVNLRYPSAAETSGIAIRMMGIGKPVLLTDGPENAAYPQDACVRIEPGLGETEHLALAIRWLRSFPSYSDAIGRRASAHIRTFHDPDVVAREYWKVFNDAVGHSRG